MCQTPKDQTKYHQRPHLCLPPGLHDGLAEPEDGALHSGVQEPGGEEEEEGDFTVN